MTNSKQPIWLREYTGEWIKLDDPVFDSWKYYTSGRLTKPSALILSMDMAWSTLPSEPTGPIPCDCSTQILMSIGCQDKLNHI